jgi:NAD(P)-dependent dehydrogenase (short-subunit alcohol dehydrogenase family)
MSTGAGYDHAYQTNTMSLRDAYNKTWNVNVTGTHIMTMTFMPLLFASSSPRVLFSASGTASLIETEDPNLFFHLNDAPPAGWPKDDLGTFIGVGTFYRSTKTGMNMMFREWVRLLKRDEKFKVFCISPGFLATNLNGMSPELRQSKGALDPAIGGNLVKDVIEGKRDGDVGKVIRVDSIQPW